MSIVRSAVAGRPSRSRLPRAAVSAWGPALAGGAIVVVLWIVGGKQGWGSGMIVTPSEALRPMLGDSRDVYVRATRATAWEATRGLVIGSVLAIVAAAVAAAVPSLRRGIGRLAAIANAAPWVAVAPCLLVVLGRGRGPTAVAAIAVFFYVFVATSVGLAAAPRATHDVLTSLGAPRRLRLFALQVPTSLPSIVDGLKLAAPAALAGAIFGEWYGAERGLGVLLISGMQSGRAERLWAASLLSAGCGLLAFAALALVRRLLVRRYGALVAQTEPTSRRTASTAARVLTEVVTSAAIAALLVLAWYTWIETADVSPLVVPRPSRVWSDLTESPGEYVSAALATLGTAAIALLIGVCFGIAVAVAAARVRTFAGAAVPVIVVMAATPLVALFPLFARIFGYAPGTVRVLAATMVFFPVFVYTRSGLTAPHGAAEDVVGALGGSSWSRFRLLTLPGAVPHVASGIRIAAGSAVIAAVVGESLIGRHGLGVEFSAAYRNLELPRAFGAAIVIIVVSVAVFAAAGAAERVVHARWT